MTNLSLRQNGNHFNRNIASNSQTTTRQLNDVIADLESIRRTNAQLLSDLSRTLHRLEALKAPRLVNEFPQSQIA
ncbi:hypothetical protein Bealeia2_01912 (plasmid) [Candidatus Bealeia paramacronuclearis]|uniref:hypothetical protein n=1 Tax=Candidatus Bealeia paramacronuclearis TaxID=1921001 RepID=UPI002BC41ADC|nr:hypothetical protein [Candidatus Bealeia paramacronuclearis]